MYDFTMYHFGRACKTGRALYRVLFFTAGMLAVWSSAPLFAEAQSANQSCEVTDRQCVLKMLTENTARIDKTAWRDQTYRELAKTLAFDGYFDQALDLVGRIETPDTQALTIRGIGMMLAHYDDGPDARNQRFVKLREAAERIKHPPSYGIALTYIAMAQAFAGDNEGAWKTAADMENDALRHKAYGETAEIQAEHGDFESADISIRRIESPAFRNKAYEKVSNILADKDLFAQSYAAAEAITNPYKKGQAMQYMLDRQSPRTRIQP